MTGGIDFSIPFDPRAVLEALDDAGVLHVLVGGVAMAAQGIPHNQWCRAAAGISPPTTR